MTNALLFAIVAAAFFQPDRERTAAAAVYIGSNLIHEFTSQFIPFYYLIGQIDASGLMYYGSASLVDVLIIVVLSKFRPTRTIVALQLISLLSATGNSIGWFLWLKDYEPDMYNFAFVVIYALALLALIQRKGPHVGDDTLNWRLASFRSHNHLWRVSIHDKPRKI